MKKKYYKVVTDDLKSVYMVDTKAEVQYSMERYVHAMKGALKKGYVYSWIVHQLIILHLKSVGQRYSSVR